MSIFDIFQTGKLRAELQKTKRERDYLKTKLVDLQSRFRNAFEEIKVERDNLKSAMSDILRMEAYGLKKAIEELNAQKQKLIAQNKAIQASMANEQFVLKHTIDSLNKEIEHKRNEIVILDEEILLQSFGFYKSRYDLANSSLYKSKLDEIRSEQSKMIKDETAVKILTTWTINNSLSQGRKLVKDYVKLVLRSFNNECDASIVKVKFNNILSIEKKLRKAFDTLNRLGEVLGIAISQDFLELKLQELYLTHEYQVKKQVEKEEQRRIRQQMREEMKVLKEIEEKKLKLQKEVDHFNKALHTIEKQLNMAVTDVEREALQTEKAKIEQKLSEVSADILTVERREQNTRAGYVYVISNIGSFGENVYKIGVTRRLDPQERIDELGSASVPFNFDVHAVIFSEDAPALEHALHKAFEHRKVNKINKRREFFRVTLDEVETVVRTSFSKPVEFVTLADADQYRQSLRLNGGDV